jgi:hypothetical protein
LRTIAALALMGPVAAELALGGVSMFDKDPRHAISRARFFLQKAKACNTYACADCEAYLEASIVFARAALHRIQRDFEGQPGWATWWASLRGDPSVEFLRYHRDWILKEAPFKVGQVVRMGVRETRAIDSYYFEDFNTPATDAIARHLERVAELIMLAEREFGARLGAT